MLFALVGSRRARGGERRERRAALHRRGAPRGVGVGVDKALGRRRVRLPRGHGAGGVAEALAIDPWIVANSTSTG